MYYGIPQDLKLSVYHMVGMKKGLLMIEKCSDIKRSLDEDRFYSAG